MIDDKSVWIGKDRSDESGVDLFILQVFKELIGGALLILARATTNVRKKTVGNKRARLGIGNAENKQYSQITYLSLPKTTGAKHRSGDERGAVRMHLRRGHPRHQHFGKGNA